jgi:hypothetical protein
MGFHYPGSGNLVFGPGPGIDNPPSVRVFPAEPHAGIIHDFDAYGPRHYGVNVACWDGDGDGFDDILTGPGPGDLFGPHVKGFTAAGSSMPGLNFLAYGTRHYGVQVGAGDLDGDGFEEILTGPGPGAIFGPHVRAFKYEDKGEPAVTPVPGVSFMAYGTRRWGVNIACGDLDGDRCDEILTGPGPGPQFAPHVRGWNIDGRPAEAMGPVSFLAYGFRKSGVRVAAGDVDGDGYDEIITAPGPSTYFGAHISGWNYDHEAIAPLAGFSFLAWSPSEVRYGARVCSGADLDALGRDELVVGAGPDPSAASSVKIYRYQNTGVAAWLSMQAFPSGWTHGAAVAAGKF